MPLQGRRCASFLCLHSQAGQDLWRAEGFRVSHRSSCRPSDCTHTHYGFQSLCLEGHRKLPSGVSTCADVLGSPYPCPLALLLSGSCHGSPPLGQARSSSQQRTLLPAYLSTGILYRSEFSSPRLPLLPAPPCLDFSAWLNQKMHDPTDQRGFVASSALALSLDCPRLTCGN